MYIVQTRQYEHWSKVQPVVAGYQGRPDSPDPSDVEGWYHGKDQVHALSMG